MTREEKEMAINQLQDAKDGYKEYLTDDVLDLVIEFIEQEPCEDAISRSDMLDAIGHGTTYTSEELQRIIKGLPPVNSQAKTGQWIRMSDLSEKEDNRYKCSHCGNVVYYKNKMDLYTFNSWCGRCGSDNGRKIEVDI